MNPAIVVLSAVIGCLSGSISFARAVTLISAPDQDISKPAVEMPGGRATFKFDAISATKVRPHVGRRCGCLVSVLDMLKAAPTIRLSLSTWSQ